MSEFEKLYRDGNILRQRNNPEAIRLLMVENFGFNHFLDGEIFKVIECLSENGINGFRVFGFWPYGRAREEEPYIRTATGYNLSRFNERYFQYLKQWISYAETRGVLVRYEMFDRCGLTTREIVSRHHPYHQLVGRNQEAFSDLRNRKLVEIQKAYIQKVIETIGQCNNVIFGIMNEYHCLNVEWHYYMSQLIRDRLPDAIISGSEHTSKAVNDPNCDLWWVHTGSFEMNTGTPHISHDIKLLQTKISGEKVLGYSTDGFMDRGKKYEKAFFMKALAADAVNADIQLLSFLDQHAYVTDGDTLRGVSSKLNLPVYKVLSKKFNPSRLIKDSPQQGEKLPLEIPTWKACYQHEGAYWGKYGRTIEATTTPGLLFFGSYQKNLPEGSLVANFDLVIDNNDFDDAYIAIIDVVEDGKRVVATKTLRRTEFPNAGQSITISLPFKSLASAICYEPRVIYLGYAHLAISRVIIQYPPGE